jgi:hypothetical protein
MEVSIHEVGKSSRYPDGMNDQPEDLLPPTMSFMRPQVNLC